MLISRSLGRKLLATSIIAVGFVLMYETKVMDFRSIERIVETADLPGDVVSAGGMHLRFTATAYCKGTTTASGVNVRTGIAAADPEGSRGPFAVRRCREAEVHAPGRHD